MEKLRFKTTIKCSSCVANVTPHLDKAVGVDKWQVDVQSPQKVLTVEAEGVSEQEIINVVQEAGYKAEKI